MIRQMSWLLALAAIAVTGCDRNGVPADQAQEPVAERAGQTAGPVMPPVSSTGAVEPVASAAWTGRWQGPEGLFLDISTTQVAGQVRLRLKDSLDGEGQYVGQVRGDTIAFERRGRVESLRRGIGSETGFSTLRSRTDCLIVQTNVEGYCRSEPIELERATSGALPVARGVYVATSDSCADPAFASVRTYDGRGLGSPHTRACVARVVSTRGPVTTFDNECIDAGSGPGLRSIQRLTMTVQSERRFTLQESDGDALSLRHCPASELPESLR